jgi:predicted Zn-dependent peptidase
VPSNCAAAIVGDFDLEEMEKKARAVFGDIDDVPVDGREIGMARPLEKDLEIEEQMDVNQAYLVLGVQGPEFAHPDQYAMDILVEILGRQIRSVVNSRFPGQRNIVHSVSMGYNPLKYGGAVLVYLRVEPDNVKTVRRETIRFLKAARTLNYSKDDYPPSQALYVTDYLENALNQIMFKAHQFNEEGLLISSALAHYLILKGGSPGASYIDEVSKVTTTDLRRVAGRYLSSNNYVSVFILPEKDK